MRILKEDISEKLVQLAQAIFSGRIIGHIRLNRLPPLRRRRVGCPFDFAFEATRIWNRTILAAGATGVNRYLRIGF
jgi:hypothetical protein